MPNQDKRSEDIDYNGIVESLYREFSLRNKRELKKQKAGISESYNARNALYSGAHINAIFKAEFDYIQRLMDHLLVSIEKNFPNIPFSKFKKRLVAVISQEYDEATPALINFARGISRGSSVERYMKQITDAKQNTMEIVDVRCKLHQAKKAANRNSIFISHAKEDASVAEVVKTQIDKVFGKGLKVFVSSIPGAIPPGSDWFDKILGNLVSADAFIVLITPNSKLRHFVWFEIGFSWLRRQTKSCEMYALFVPPINAGELPEPLCRLQAVSLAKENETKAFFNKLVEQFGLGNIDTLDFTQVLESLPKYPPQKTQQVSGGDLYDSRYADYSPEELKQVVVDILSVQKRRHEPGSGGHSPIFNGELIDFKNFDRRNKLPPGTSKKYLKEAAKEFQLEVESEGENTIRFEKQDWHIL